jgi:hypothetical protein
MYKYHKNSSYHISLYYVMFRKVTLSKARSIIGIHSHLLAILISLQWIFLYFKSAWKPNRIQFPNTPFHLLNFMCTVGDSVTTSVLSFETFLRLWICRWVFSWPQLTRCVGYSISRRLFEVPSHAPVCIVCRISNVRQNWSKHGAEKKNLACVRNQTTISWSFIL